MHYTDIEAIPAIQQVIVFAQKISSQHREELFEVAEACFSAGAAINPSDIDQKISIAAYLTASGESMKTPVIEALTDILARNGINQPPSSK